MSKMVGTTQFNNERLAEEMPIFKKMQVNFTPKHPLTHLVVSNSNIVMALANRTLIRIDQDLAPDVLEEIDLNKFLPGTKISNLFLDSTGKHLLISLKSTADGQAELVYLPKKSIKPRICGKVKGNLVSAVAFSPESTGEGSTGPVLLGTTLGLIIETELCTDERMFTKEPEIYYKQLYDIGKGQHVPVTGLEYHNVPNTTKYYVIATTPHRMYQLQGYVSNSSERPLLHHVFNNYLNKAARFLEFPSSLKYSTLSMFYSQQGKRRLPSHFGWLTEPGLYTGKIDPWEGDSDSVTVDCQLINPLNQEIPKHALVTEFHVMLLYPDRVKGRIHITIIRGEMNYFWASALDLILTKQAEKLFDEKRYVESAMHYAKTKSSFEEVTLKFMGVEEKNALTNYLKRKLEGLRPSEKTQITLIVLWLIEIYQNKLGLLREKEEGKEMYLSEQTEFLAFLRQPRVEECIKNNRDTVYGLLGSHGDMEHLIFLADALHDTEKVVIFNIRNKEFEKALNILVRNQSPQLFYEFCPVLLKEIPTQTVDAFIKLDKRLDASKVLPSIMVTTESKDPKVICECIRFLEHSVNSVGCEDEALHNLLLSLYVSQQPHKIIPYIISAGSQPRVDVKYVLKLCLDAGLQEEGVYLLTLLDQHQQSMELALTINIDLAVKCAAGELFGSKLSEDTSKKLWLRVARHVVQEKNDIKQAMQFLTQCPSVKIEDILPFFPDFVTIDHFKSAIVESLQEYSKHISDLKDEMSEASSSAQVIRDEISQAKSRYQFIRATDRCSTCGDLLLSREFYLFSCSHRFHTDCLTETVLPHLGQARRRRVGELQGILAQSQEETSSTFSGQTKQEMASQELADIIAGECCFCGELMIRDIDTPFIEDQVFQQTINDWL
ncbi:vacuolar protein sorting-associated protein 18 homolog [Eurytemora carolleeae]|uniref:vacuolar protein sorting-associated protein 18 homolog n=1 Tax=Eurytemora carolleeae TaxID=1294199 RepID=UPI000C757281|nr:vacuolar protein sorting-associated protein 18 homolog [Eurytemora carolleeae]|eukprot:XP_023332203.1 vacuolar protein sorting-associated protein 18 homolog [Eurytemora affinis]